MIVPSVRMVHFLNELCFLEWQDGGPLITVGVINKHTGIPGDGFFTFATALGERISNREAFCAEQWIRSANASSRYEREVELYYRGAISVADLEETEARLDDAARCSFACGDQRF